MGKISEKNTKTTTKHAPRRPIIFVYYLGIIGVGNQAGGCVGLKPPAMGVYTSLYTRWPLWSPSMFTHIQPRSAIYSLEFLFYWLGVFLNMI
jgi:hypothetical protein